jgi:hypothetical protein
MPKTNIRAAVAIFLVALYPTWRISTRLLELRQALKAKTTVTRMKELMGILDTEHPAAVSSVTLHRLLEKYNRQDPFHDGWGNEFMIERKGEGENTVYRILSLGRDGVRGPCCDRWIASWDGDAVLEGPRWLQVWYPKAVPNRNAAR